MSNVPSSARRLAEMRGARAQIAIGASRGPRPETAIEGEADPLLVVTDGAPGLIAET